LKEASQNILKIAAVGSSVTARCYHLIMERLFSPCTRLRDIIDREESISEDMKEELHCIKEQSLNLDVSTEELRIAMLERAFTYANLHAMLDGDSLVWFTRSAVVFRKHELANIYSRLMYDANYSFTCNADGQQVNAVASSSNELLEICDVLLRLVAAKSDVRSVILSDWSSVTHVSINATRTSLAYLMEQCPSLKALTLTNIEMEEDQIRVLGAYSRQGLEIVLFCCQLTSAGTSALAEVLGRNQGPTKLEICDIDYSVLANGLRGNSRLKSLTTRISSEIEYGNRQVHAIASALWENKGLVELNLSCYGYSKNDETWDSICNSLKAHPTLEILHLPAINNDASTAPAFVKYRIQALLYMMKVSTSIHTIILQKCYSDHELFRGSVIPYLETNRLRPRVHAIQKTSPSAYRAKVLGRALLSTRTDANSFWMLLSGNPEVISTATATGNLTTATTASVASTAVPSSRQHCLRRYFFRCWGYFYY
jgi:hypothetical protein